MSGGAIVARCGRRRGEVRPGRGPPIAIRVRRFGSSLFTGGTAVRRGVAVRGIRSVPGTFGGLPVPRVLALFPLAEFTLRRGTFGAFGRGARGRCEPSGSLRRGWRRHGTARVGGAGRGARRPGRILRRTMPFAGRGQPRWGTIEFACGALDGRGGFHARRPRIGCGAAVESFVPRLPGFGGRPRQRRSLRSRQRCLRNGLPLVTRRRDGNPSYVGNGFAPRVRRPRRWLLACRRRIGDRGSLGVQRCVGWYLTCRWRLGNGWPLGRGRCFGKRRSLGVQGCVGSGHLRRRLGNRWLRGRRQRVGSRPPSW